MVNIAGKKVTGHTLMQDEFTQEIEVA